jgi:IS30 family transposase
MARPSSLTPELRERIERELADGVPVVVVAQRAHVAGSTLHRWLQRGDVMAIAKTPSLKASSRRSGSSSRACESLRPLRCEGA